MVDADLALRRSADDRLLAVKQIVLLTEPGRRLGRDQDAAGEVSFDPFESTGGSPYRGLRADEDSTLSEAPA